MIISFSSTDSPREILFSSENTDIFTFFHSENSLIVPRDQWSLALASSLKLKRNILVLESYREDFPPIDQAARWQLGDSFLWMAPRSLSVLLEAAHAYSGSYELVKAFISKSK